MSNMAPLPWQHQHWQHLQNYVQQQRIPQALLIGGNKGLGKSHLAKQFAAALLCHQQHTDGTACGICSSCLLFNANTHPDLLLIQPEEAGKNITVAQVRSLITKLSLKPQFEGYRVVIINPADAMNNAAANAFLKCLEEPTERTCIILITDKPNRLPATIMSRCQRLTLKLASKALFCDWLNHHAIYDDLDLLYSLSKGAPLLAQQYVADNAIDLRNTCFKNWLAVAKQQDHPVFVAERWLAFPEALVLFWLTSWVMDLIKCIYRINVQYMYNPDLLVSLQELSVQLDLQGLYKLYDLLLLNQQRLGSTLNSQLMLEEILLEWSALNGKLTRLR